MLSQLKEGMVSQIELRIWINGYDNSSSSNWNGNTCLWSL